MSSMQRPLVRPLKTGDAAERAQARQRAEELRIIADETVDEDSRVVLLRLAQCYERMAARGEAVPTTAARGESPWPLKLRASVAVPPPRSVPRRTA